MYQTVDVKGSPEVRAEATAKVSLLVTGTLHGYLLCNMLHVNYVRNKNIEISEY